VRSLAAELAPRRIQVNAICPGWVNTEMAWQGLDAMGVGRERAFEEAMREVPLRRMSEPSEIAGTVASAPLGRRRRRHRADDRPQQRGVHDLAARSVRPRL
jgi:NAD(P)-dependent dehydrogenase (short-subunit alcohol dehydrogenase family)